MVFHAYRTRDHVTKAHLVKLLAHLLLPISINSLPFTKTLKFTSQDYSFVWYGDSVNFLLQFHLIWAENTEEETLHRRLNVSQTSKIQLILYYMHARCIANIAVYMGG